MFSVTPRPLFTPAKDPVTIVQEAGWAPGPVWTSAETPACFGASAPSSGGFEVLFAEVIKKLKLLTLHKTLKLLLKYLFFRIDAATSESCLKGCPLNVYFCGKILQQKCPQLMTLEI